MSCRHDLANSTCIRCYPDRGGTDSNGRPQIDPGPDRDSPNLDGPGAVEAAAPTVQQERAMMKTFEDIGEWIEEQTDKRFPWKDTGLDWGRVRIRALTLANDAVNQFAEAEKSTNCLPDCASCAADAILAGRRTTETRRDYDELQARYEAMAVKPTTSNSRIGTTLDSFLDAEDIKGEVYEMAALRTALVNVSGALCDSGVVVPDDPVRYGEVVRDVIGVRDEHYRKLINYWATFGAVDDDAGKRWLDLQEKRVDAERESAANAERRTTETRRDYDELQARYETTVGKLAKAEEARDGLNSGWKRDQTRWRGEEFELKGKLGRAVAALRDARIYLSPIDVEQAAISLEASAILADADSAAAGEAWRELVSAAGEAIDSAEDETVGISVVIQWKPLDRLCKALAKVDARRGGGR